MSAPVQTAVRGVLGDIDPAKLGMTLTHEHLLLDMYRITLNVDHVLNNPEAAVLGLTRFKDAGGTTVVDATNIGLGRDPHKLVRIARESGVNVVMGCGWYRESFYPGDVDRRSTNSLADEIVHDIEDGVGESGIRAGVIGEIGSDGDFISGQEERVLRAAARAHQHTGLTVTTHAVRCPLGLEQIDLLESEGVEPHRVIVGHCDLYPDTAYHEAVAERGAWVEFDRVNGRHAYEVDRRIRWILNLLGKGFIGRLLLSHDVCARTDLRVYGGTGYDYIASEFVDRLRDVGLTQAQLDQILVANPSAALTGSR